MPKPIDVRALGCRERQERVLAAFDALAPGAAMCMIIDHPKPILLAFEAERSGAYDWHVRDATPGAWRIEVVRRRAPSTRAAFEYLLYDHRRLRALLEEVDAAIAAHRWGQAAARFAEFVGGLDRHIDVEENLLFPFFVKEIGDEDGVVGRLCAEHGAMRSIMGDLAAAITDRGAVTWTRGFRGLCELWEAHDALEEQLLGPWMDRFAEAFGGSEALVQRLLSL